MVALNYNSKVWAGQHDTETQTVIIDGQPETITLQHYAATFDDQTGRTPNVAFLRGGWSILQGPAIKTKLIDIEPLPASACPGVQGVTLFKYGLTKAWLMLADGSEVQLRDDLTDGAPYLRSAPCVTQGDRDRGRAWHSVDGSAITYVTDANNGVVLGQFAGYVLLSDGARMRINNNGKCTRIIDANGNYVTIDYQSGGLVVYTDQLGRQVRLQPAQGVMTVTDHRLQRHA